MSNRIVRRHKRKLFPSKSSSDNSSVSADERAARRELKEFLGQDYSQKQKRIKVVEEPEDDDLFLPIREISLGGRRKRKTRKRKRKRKTKKRRKSKKRRKTKKRRR